MVGRHLYTVKTWVRFPVPPFYLIISKVKKVSNNLDILIYFSFFLLFFH